MAQIWNWTWLTIAFLSELAALAALAAWGWSASGSTPVRVLLAVGTPVAAAVLWGVFAAPHAPVHNAALTLLVKVAVFGAGVLALLATGHPRLAIALGAAALLSSLLSPDPDAAAVSG
jgi:exosortase/archaeosortase